MRAYAPRRATLAAILAGLLALATVAIELADPDTDDPSSFVDHAAVLIFSLALIAAGAALAFLRPAVTSGTATRVLAFAAAGALAAGVGNFFEDSIGIEASGVFFALGGLALVAGLLVAGVSITVRTPSRRWLGPILFLLAVGVIIGEVPGFALVGVTWLAVAALLVRESPSAFGYG